MSNILIPQKQFSKLVRHVKGAAQVINVVYDADTIAKKRMAEIEADPSIGKSEEELMAYLKKRGVRIDPVEN